MCLILLIWLIMLSIKGDYKNKCNHSHFFGTLSSTYIFEGSKYCKIWLFTDIILDRNTEKYFYVKTLPESKVNCAKAFICLYIKLTFTKLTLVKASPKIHSTSSCLIILQIAGTQILIKWINIIKKKENVGKKENRRKFAELIMSVF